MACWKIHHLQQLINDVPIIENTILRGFSSWSCLIREKLLRRQAFFTMELNGTHQKWVGLWHWVSHINYILPSGKLTVRPWHIGVGRLVSIKNW